MSNLEYFRERELEEARKPFLPRDRDGAVRVFYETIVDLLRKGEYINDSLVNLFLKDGRKEDMRLIYLFL